MNRKVLTLGIIGAIMAGAYMVAPDPPPRERGKAPEAPRGRTFTESDIFFDDDTRPYKELIVRAVNKIAREDSRCRASLDPGTVVKSPSKSKPGKPIFFVMCGASTNVVNVYFSEEDLSEGRPSGHPSTSIGQGQSGFARATPRTRPTSLRR